MDVVPAGESSEELFRKGMAMIPSEGACYPSKIAYGHAQDLVERGATILFAPALGLDFSRVGLLGGTFSFVHALPTCPLVEEMGNLIAMNCEGTAVARTQIIAPDLREASSLEDLADPSRASLQESGILRGMQDVTYALQASCAEFKRFRTRLDAARVRALAHVDSGELQGVLLAGHGYHADPGIGHGIDELLAKMGYAVIEQGEPNPSCARALQLDSNAVTVAHAGTQGCKPENANLAKSRLLSHHGGSSEGSDAFLWEGDDFEASEEPKVSESSEAAARLATFCREGWQPNADIARTIETSAAHPNLGLVVLCSFGCGIDALSADAVHDALRAAGRVYAEIKLDQIVDLAAVRIRLRSLAYARAHHDAVRPVRKTEALWVRHLS